MKERRIVKRTRKNGLEIFLVEERKLLFGRVICDWYPSQRKIYFNEAVIKKDATFKTLEDAMEFCGIKTNPIVKEEVVFTNIKKK